MAPSTPRIAASAHARAMAACMFPGARSGKRRPNSVKLMSPPPPPPPPPPLADVKPAEGALAEVVAAEAAIGITAAAAAVAAVAAVAVVSVWSWREMGALEGMSSRHCLARTS